MNTTTAQRRVLDLRIIIVATLLALLAILAVCAVPTARAYAATPISTAEELQNISPGSGKEYILTADIDLSGEEWTPIGKPSKYNDGNSWGFQGIFDGNGHTISNVRISSFSVSVNGNDNVQYAGFFGCTNGATIKNLTLQNVTVSGTYSKNGANDRDLMVGALVGLAVRTNISGCNVINATIQDSYAGEHSDSNNYAIGGLVGDFYMESTNSSKSISNCSVVNAKIQASAQFSETYTGAQAFTGGIVGRLRERDSALNKANVVNCIFDGEVRGSGFVGPIVGGARSGEAALTAADISKEAADFSASSYYSGTSGGLNGGVPNASYNSGDGVWDAGGNYTGTTRVTDGNRAEVLGRLDSDDNKWRIAVLDTGNTLVRDFRKAAISEPVYAHGAAEVSVQLEGYYGSADENAAQISWLVDGVEKGAGASFVVPLSANQQTVEMRVMDGDKERLSDSTTIEAAQLEFAISKSRDEDGDVKSVSVFLRSVSDVFADDDFTYAWYGLKEGSDPVHVGDGETLSSDRFQGFENFKAVATSKANPDLSFELTAHTSGRTVYLSINGNDGNSGFDPKSPVKTFRQAYMLLKKDAPREANIIVVMDQYTNTEFGYDDTTFNRPATITSYDADLNVDYRDRGAYLCFYNTSGANHKGDDGTLISGKLLYADTTFKDITLSAEGAKSSFDIGYIYCQGNSLTMDTGVRMEGYRRAAATGSNGYGLLAGTNANDFNIVGGFANYDKPPEAGWDGGTCEIVLRSGSYSRVIAGGRNFEVGNNKSVNKTSHNQFGTEDKPFNVKITVDIDASQSQKGTGGNTCDIGQLTGGQTDGTIYCNSTITLVDGVVPQLFGSSIGYNRNVNPDGTTSYPNNDFVGTTTVNMEGGSVAQLYGGCLGRATDSNSTVVVDARFRSSKNTPGGQADIVINIGGNAMIGPISGITAPLTGVFAAGAGGITGVGDAATGRVDNEVDVSVNISGGTISGNLYGGGYGQSSAVTAAGLACLEAGNLYGSSTVNITGGTINADVYGGGAGTDAYLANNKDANALAQIVGDVKLSISNADINGSVYGGSQGVVESEPDCTSMAKITGNVELSIENTHIAGSVYGGSALGTVTGNVKTTLNGNGSTIDGSVYGAGKGQLVPAYDLDEQQTVGLVGGGASLDISGYSISGSVYGGGSVGAVLGSGGVATTLTSVNVTGSVYGGGEGSLIEKNTDAERQALIGQVASNAALSIDGGKVEGSVYGGGSKGAVLGSADVQIRRTEISGSAYAAGEGAYLEGNSDVPLQKVIGWVQGGASIALADDAWVGGSVFGGGHLGVVGDGALSSGSVPYSIASAADISVRVENARVGKSVFGGGEGEASAGSLMSRLVGAVFGTASVTVHEGAIGADVFGGGDQSYSYAPLGDNGNPAQAATVVINGGGALHVNEDGSVADGPDNGAREVDAPAGDAATQRAISLGGSVFGGGNISEAHTVSANNYTMYGDTEVFVKGQGVDFAGSDRGGVYGDGNLSRAYGERTVTLVELRTPQEDGTLAAKKFFSLQRANRAVVHDCSIYLQGAKDLVNESDQTPYSLNRVDNLNLYANSTVQFDTVVNGLGNLYSDVLPERTFTSDWDGLKLGDFGDNVGDEEKDGYRKFATGQARAWNDAKGGTHTTTNTIIVNNGKWLDVKQAADAADASYGVVTGLFSLVSSDASSGGAFVFGRLSPNDSTGTFVSLNTQQNDWGAGPYLELYTKSTSDVDSKPCRVWFIKGDAYTYERDLRAYTTSDSASIRVLLPVEWAEDGKMSIVVDEPFVIEGAEDMRKVDGEEGKKYDVGMVLGGGDDKSERLSFYSGENAQWSYNYSDYAKQGEGLALLPATITIDIDDLGTNEELKEQKGTVKFSLLAGDGTTQYKFVINVIIEPVYAVAYETVYPGRVYENIAVENTIPITPTSSYTAQFTTTYSPGAYRSAVEATLNAFTTEAIHDVKQEGLFPAGTKITMVNITDPMRPAYYYYECKDAIETIPLADFKSMSTGESYKNPTGNTVIVEDLLFVVDYSAANGGSGKAEGTTYLALNHLYGKDDSNKKDILRYNRTKEDGSEDPHYNNLWNSYTISSVTDGTYLNSRLESPINAASVAVSHTSNFMYDTYTTKLSLASASNCVSTLFDENHVMLQLSLSSTAGGENKALPLGSRIVVKRPDGTEVATRYYHEQNKGFLMADLGNDLESSYTIELQVSRYLAGGALESVFGAADSQYKLNADLYVSADGLYRSADDEPYASREVEFSAARAAGVAPPAYELGPLFENKKYLEVEDGEVHGTLPVDDLDAQMTLLRRAVGEDSVDVTASSVTRTVVNGKVTFTVSDAPPSGTYEYEIHIGNTVYFQTVAVP